MRIGRATASKIETASVQADGAHICESVFTCKYKFNSLFERKSISGFRGRNTFN